MSAQHRPYRIRGLRTWADGLTLARAIAGLPLIVFLLADHQVMAWGLLLVAGLSDAADGWLARRAGGGSSWGARLDPLADKILIAAPLIWLASREVLPLWAVWLLLARELLISGWRSGVPSGGPASSAGKAKTILQFICLLMLLWPSIWGGSLFSQNLHRLGWWLFWPSLILALSSAVNYIKPQSDPDPH